ncbi:Retrotransposon-derived protein PEG10 [Crotalus adamanteus]|uniref:Retrotransposon-derived protein PEG10 n=1 Tax=Crotalus adamanteus TaxID=8729 RepID=A0AAW1CB54_CROAD
MSDPACNLPIGIRYAAGQPWRSRTIERPAPFLTSCRRPTNDVLSATRFLPRDQLVWGKTLVGLRQRGRPAKEYIREFQKIAGRLRSWTDRLLVHHFRTGLDTDIRRACVVRGVGGRLADWFRAAVELDIGLREHPSGRENRPPPRRSQDQPTGRTTQTVSDTACLKAVFKCFRCNRPGHRAAECGIPAPTSTPTAIGRPGSTPQKTAEKSRVAYQTGQTPIQPSSGDTPPTLQEYEEEGPVEDPMVSEPIIPFTIPVTITSPVTGGPVVRGGRMSDPARNLPIGIRYAAGQPWRSRTIERPAPFLTSCRRPTNDVLSATRFLPRDQLVWGKTVLN